MAAGFRRKEKGEEEMKWLLVTGLIGYILNIYICLKQGGNTYEHLWMHVPGLKEEDIASWLATERPSLTTVVWIVFSMGLSFLAGLGIYELSREKVPILGLLFLLTAVLYLLFRSGEEILHIVGKIIYCTRKGGKEAFESFQIEQVMAGLMWILGGLFRTLASILYIILILRRAIPVPWPFLFVNPALFSLVFYHLPLKEGGDIGAVLALLIMLVIL